jgi:hypothetical protein
MYCNKGSKNDISCFYKKQNNERILKLIIIKIQETRKHGYRLRTCTSDKSSIYSSCKTVLRPCHIVLAINENHILYLDF